MNQITPREFLTAVAEIYDENIEEFVTTDLKPQNINYLVGKLMVKTKGNVSPELSMKIIKAITDSGIQNNFKVKL